jgi:ribosomal protein L1
MNSLQLDILINIKGVGKIEQIDAQIKRNIENHNRDVKRYYDQVNKNNEVRSVS